MKLNCVIKIICFVCTLQASSSFFIIDAKAQQNFVEGQLIVQLDEGITPDILTANFTSIGLLTNKLLFAEAQIWLFDYNPSSLLPNDAIAAIKQNPFVINAQLNHILQLNSTFPNDPNFAQQYAMTKIKAPEVWDITTGGVTAIGDQITVAVIDKGFDLNHPDLTFHTNIHDPTGDANNDGCPGDCGVDDDNDGLVDEDSQNREPGDQGYSNDLVNDDDENGFPDDINGWNATDDNGNIVAQDHGTHISGTIGAIGNNNTGVAGVNWNVNILPIIAKTNEAEMIRGYGYAFAMRRLYDRTNSTKGAFVVVTNLSASNNHSGGASATPIWCALYDILGLTAGIININAPFNTDNEIKDANGFSRDVPALCSSPFLVVVN